LRRLTVGAVACCVAMLVYQTVWHPEATHAAATETSRAGSAVRFADWSASSLPALKVAAAAAADAEAAPVARDGVIDAHSSTSQTSTRPGWAWLVDLIFTPPEPAA
jgi:type II secretory pathway component PulM